MPPYPSAFGSCYYCPLYIALEYLYPTPKLNSLSVHLLHNMKCRKCLIRTRKSIWKQILFSSLPFYRLIRNGQKKVLSYSLFTFSYNFPDYIQVALFFSKKKFMGTWIEKIKTFWKKYIYIFSPPTPFRYSTQFYHWKKT